MLSVTILPSLGALQMDVPGMQVGCALPRANALLSESCLQMGLVSVGSLRELLGESGRSPEERGYVTLRLGALPTPPPISQRASTQQGTRDGRHDQ